MEFKKADSALFNKQTEETSKIVKMDEIKVDWLRSHSLLNSSWLNKSQLLGVKYYINYLKNTMIRVKQDAMKTNHVRHWEQCPGYTKHITESHSLINF